MKFGFSSFRSTAITIPIGRSKHVAKAASKRFCGMNRTICRAANSVIVPGVCLPVDYPLRTGAIANFSPVTGHRGKFAVRWRRVLGILHGFFRFFASPVWLPAAL